MHYYYDPDTDTIKSLNTTVTSKEELDALYETIMERWERDHETKFTVQVLQSDSLSYLNHNLTKDNHSIKGAYEQENWQTHFTQAEINALKQRDDIAIDWDKAIIKRVDDE